jgi:hypothetical protein
MLQELALQVLNSCYVFDSCQIKYCESDSKNTFLLSYQSNQIVRIELG